MIDFENIFLPNTTVRHSNYFVGMDTQDKFEKNIKILPPSWHYRTKQITYKCNKLKYRNEEFENIEWDKSIVLLGCSNVFGVGLSEDETIGAQIENLTGIKTVNMGIGGGSMFHSLTNLINILNMNIQPLAVVNIWSSIERFLYFTSTGVVPIGPWSLDKHDSFVKEFFKIWTQDSNHTQTLANIIQQNSKLLCKNIKYYECTFFDKTAISLNVTLLSITDLARDRFHPGPESAKTAAKNIISNLRLS